MDFKKKKLIIFDFDGTLINSIPDLTLAINMMLKKFNKQELSIETTTPFIGNGALALVQRALEHSFKDYTEATLEKAFRIYLESYRDITCKDTYLYNNVRETLKKLKNKGYNLVICTNKPLEFVEPILKKLEIKEYFSDWIGEDSLSKKKPDALPLLHLAEKTNSKIQECVMVGDSKNDILAAQNAKMDSIGVSYGYNYNENIADYNPTVVVDEFKELEKLFL